MDSELGTDPELLWRLLLVQLVYDEMNSKKTEVNYELISTKYRKHPLLPHNAPVLASGSDAEAIYRELLTEYEIDNEKTGIEQCQLLAEPLYIAFHKNLLDQMNSDVSQFEEVYKQLEKQLDFPKDERL